MDEFIGIIYEQWRYNHPLEDNAIDWGDYDETIHKIYDFLNEKIADDLEIAINKTVWSIEKAAFIAGFKYACKCLSHGKIEIKDN